MAASPRRFTELVLSEGSNPFILVEVTVTERLSQPLLIEIEAVTEEYVSPEALLGKPVSVRTYLNDQESRCFNGHFFRVAHNHPIEGLWTYRMVARSWPWFLTRDLDFRIFQNRTVPEIVREVCTENGFAEIDERLNGEYPKLEYCVQYRETDLDFISRLLEREGIYYYFDHAPETGMEMLVLADEAGLIKSPVEGEDILYLPSLDEAVEEPRIHSLEVEKIHQPSRFVLTDFDFTRPSTRLESFHTQRSGHERDQFVVYEYPGNYRDTDQGDRYARIRMESLKARYAEIRGESDVRTLIPGATIGIRTHAKGPDTSIEGRFLITEVLHTFMISGPYSGEGREESYSNSFTVIPAEIPYRPEIRTPKPRIAGPQTAIVVGPQGEEIYTDEYGRVKVQFHWDRLGKKDENSSCWIRVAQMWAGKKWGAIHLPRIGQEVIVEFLEGDPDRPIITGRVYNGEQMPPYDLPAQKTRSGVKSRSLDGSPSNYNEIRFEDKKGAEEIHIHAERNLRTTVENDELLRVGRDRERTVERDETGHVKRNRSLKIDGQQEVKVNLFARFKVGSGYEETMDNMGSHTLRADLGQKIHVGSKGRNETIDGPLIQTLNATLMQNIQGSALINASNGYSIISPKGINIMAAPAGITIMDTTLKLAGSSKIEAENEEKLIKAHSVGITGFKAESGGIVLGFDTFNKSDSLGAVIKRANVKNDKAWVLTLLSETTGIETSTLKILF